MRGIHPSPVDSPHKGRWRGALMLSLNKRLSKQSRRRWFETLWRLLWRQSKDVIWCHQHALIHFQMAVAWNSRLIAWLILCMSLPPGMLITLTLWPLGFEWDFRYVIFKWTLVIDGWGISCEVALIWMSLDFTDDQSTLVQVMVWCRQATSHYLSQCWPRSLSPYVVTRPQWVNK